MGEKKDPKILDISWYSTPPQKQGHKQLISE